MFKCEFCEKEFDTQKKLDIHIVEKHDDTLPVKCEICGKGHRDIGKLQRHLNMKHKMDATQRLEYYDKYIKKEDETGCCKQCGKRLKLVKDSFTNGYMKFCYNTNCNVLWYNQNTDRLDKFSKSFKETLKENPQNNNSTIEYWTHRGYTEEEAKIKQSERQTTFSKEKCIEKYGEDEGLKVWQDRQDKWKSTLDNKSPEEKMRINRLKAWSSGRMSNAEIEICEQLPVTPQFCISDEIGYVYDMYDGNKKIIEYHGDYWHCNPTKYAPDYYNTSTNMYARDKWIADEKKIQYAIDKGYEVLVIWEHEYNEDKELVLERCRKFLEE